MNPLRPEGWDLIGRFPDGRERGARIDHHWDLSLAEPLAYEGETYRLIGSLAVDVQLHRESDEVFCTLELAGEVATHCCRCLCDLTVAINERFVYAFRVCQGTDGKDQEEQYADPVIDLQVSRLTGPIELGDLVWECFLVSLPRYAGCEGECATPLTWQNDSSDLRWGPLAELLNTEKGGNQDGDA